MPSRSSMRTQIGALIIATSVIQLAIKEKGAPFISRGDRSGTHLAELSLWKLAGIDIEKDKGPWYRDTGQGMGPALNSTSSMNAYILSDRGTWISFKNRGDLASDAL